jgi:hypothetical protein
MATLPNTNFLATQVWPSARVAAMALERYITSLYNYKKNNGDKKVRSLTICEFGCGPGLPSLTAAVVSKRLQQQRHQQEDHQKLPVLSPILVSKVYATDVDSFALKLVQAAAKEQAVMTNLVETHLFDLTSSSEDVAAKLPAANLYIFSDVFESSAVALGAARTTCRILTSYNSREALQFGSFVNLIGHSDMFI